MLEDKKIFKLNYKYPPLSTGNVKHYKKKKFKSIRENEIISPK